MQAREFYSTLQSISAHLNAHHNQEWRPSAVVAKATSVRKEELVSTSYMLLTPTWERNAFSFGCARMSFCGTHVTTCNADGIYSQIPACPCEVRKKSAQHGVAGGRGTVEGALHPIQAHGGLKADRSTPLYYCLDAVQLLLHHQAPRWASASIAPCMAAAQMQLPLILFAPALHAIASPSRSNRPLEIYINGAGIHVRLHQAPCWVAVP